MTGVEDSHAPATQGRRLVVMRHAKAEQAGRTDAERPLAHRGHRDAADAGRWLAEQGFVAEAALVSSALRTVETWQALCAGAGWDDALGATEHALYSGGPETALDLVRETDPAIRALVVVGHNPTMGWLALDLDDGEGVLDPGAPYPTSALTVFEVRGAWTDVAGQSCRAVAHHVGRG
jgi:phosphohistidine phosphatase